MNRMLINECKCCPNSPRLARARAIFFRATNADRSVLASTRASQPPALAPRVGPGPFRPARRAVVPASFRSPGTGTAGGGTRETEQAKKKKVKKEERGGERGRERERIGRTGLPALPHKYGFSRAVYDRKRVEPRERSRA